MQAMPRKQAFLIGCCWVGTLLQVGCGQESPSSDDDDGPSEREEVEQIDEEEAFVSIDCDAWQNAPAEPRGCVNQPIYCNDEIESTMFGSTSKLGDDFIFSPCDASWSFLSRIWGCRVRVTASGDTDAY